MFTAFTPVSNNSIHTIPIAASPQRQSIQRPVRQKPWPATGVWARWWATPLLGILLASTLHSAEWFPFDPTSEPAPVNSLIDLRHLNEQRAGSHGFITAKDGRFHLGPKGEPVRFWAVNGPPSSLTDPDALRRHARLLARHGVNLVRYHSPVFDAAGGSDLARIDQLHTMVDAFAAEGIYTLFSIYFPLWFKPAPDNPLLEGYDGNQHPFGALYFNEKFQEQYRKWWYDLLVRPGPNGHSLISNPAVMGLELINEDSLFFWTFSERNLPEPQRHLFESQFAEWLVTRHGSLTKAFETWNGLRVPSDTPDNGRIGFRGLWNIFSERTLRDQDTARFLFETQAGFYEKHIKYLRDLGFSGVITTSNWTTADNRVLGPLEKLSYASGDFQDRHGYLSCNHQGEHSAWSIRVGQTFMHRSALRFDGDKPGAKRSFNHPGFDIGYGDQPSMISETTWNRPNRYRGEAPLFLAVYGALQDTDAIVHFAMDGSEWRVQPNYFMQPWTLMAPTQMGQFPAAALIYRKGLVRTGPVIAEIRLNRDRLFALEGTPLPQDAAFDELRLADVPKDSQPGPGQVLDPLLHLVGRASVQFSTEQGSVRLNIPEDSLDHGARRIRSATKDLDLDYGHGLLRIQAPSAQGASGNVAAASPVNLPDIRIESESDLLHLVVVSLDDNPLNESQKMLVQVMTEEQPTDWKVEPEPDADGIYKILSIGKDPWQVRRIKGRLAFLRTDAAALKIQPLDLLGRPTGETITGGNFTLREDTVYYLVTRPE